MAASIDIGLTVAFIGGILTLFAPCAAMLLPSFFALAFSSRKQLVLLSVLFIGGLLAVLVPLGAFAGTLGATLRLWSSQVALVAGVVIVILGLVQMFQIELLPWRRKTAKVGVITPVNANRAGSGIFAGAGAHHLNSISAESTCASTKDVKKASLAVTSSDEAKKKTQTSRSASSPMAVFLLGAGYGLAGVGCAGPILGSVLTVAGLGGSPLRGGLLMVAFAFGMGLPVVLLAAIWSRARLGERGWLRPRTVKVLGRTTTLGNLISGALFVLLGAALAITGGQFDVASILDPDQFANVEEYVRTSLASVPDWLVITIAVLVIALVWMWSSLLKQSRNGSSKVEDSSI